MSELDPTKLDKLKVAELREELKKRGLDTKGTKPVLVKRLKKSLTDGSSADDSLNEGDTSQEALDTSQEALDTSQEALDTSQDDSSQEANVSRETEQIEEPQPEPEPVQPEPEPEPVKAEEENEPEPQVEEEQEEMETESAPQEEEPAAPVQEVVPEIKAEPAPIKEEEAAVEEESPVVKEEPKPETNGDAQMEEEGAEQVKEEMKDEKTDGDAEKDEHKGEKRKRSRSRDRDRRRSRSRSRDRNRDKGPKKGRLFPVEMEDDTWKELTTMQLDRYNCDLNLRVVEGGTKAHPLSVEGFAMMWAGARATYGVTSGKVAFEIKLLDNLSVDHLPEEETTPHVLRVGWSTDDNTMQLGEEELSYGYGGTAKASTNCKFEDYGEKFSTKDVITAYLDLDSDTATISFAKNGEDLGQCFEVDREKLGEKALFPHVLSKNMEFELNFGAQEEPWFPLKEEYAFIESVPVESRVRGTLPPEKKEDCLVIMMVGLPGVGKTTWATKHSQENPEMKFNILGTNNIIDKMKVMGLPRKRNYAGRWDVLIDKATKCLNRIIEVASRRKRNYILDQTNVYASARRRKMQPFEGFQRKAVVIVPTDEEFKSRVEKREKEEGKDVPEKAILEMKANFTIPDKGCLFDEVEFTELEAAESETLVGEYRETAQKALPPPEKRFRGGGGGGGDRWGGGGRGGGGRFERRDNRYGGGGRSGGYDRKDNRYGSGGGGGYRNDRGPSRYGGGGGGGYRDNRDRYGGGGGSGGRYDRDRSYGSSYSSGGYGGSSGYGSGGYSSRDSGSSWKSYDRSQGSSSSGGSSYYSGGSGNGSGSSSSSRSQYSSSAQSSSGWGSQPQSSSWGQTSSWGQQSQWPQQSYGQWNYSTTGQQAAQSYNTNQQWQNWNAAAWQQYNQQQATAAAASQYGQWGSYTTPTTDTTAAAATNTTTTSR